MQLCEYGCGKPAKYQFKNGKWCCSSHCNKCSSHKKIISKTSKGREHSEETKLKIGLAHKGHISWNKGISPSEDVKRKIGESNKGKIPWNKGKKTGLIPWNKGKKMTMYSAESSKYLKITMRTTINKIKKRNLIFSKIEKMRYNPIEPKEIQVHCKNHECKNSKEQGGWFTPTRIQFFERIRQIEKGNGGAYLYCCEKCKQECPLYYLKSDPNKETKKLYTQEEYQTWRLNVLERENYICEYCEEPAIDSHHSRPQKLEPGFVLDPDFGVACCESCHYKYGHKNECSTGTLAAKICN